MTDLVAGVDPRRPTTVRLLLFSSGDFACNLYWQSSVFYLLYFYTDVLRLAPALAGAIAMLGSLWDGLADLAVGLLAQRGDVPLRRFVVVGAVPLGVSFVAMYLSPAGGADRVALLALAAQLLFRTFYALVNVAYSAWSVRISPHSNDRAIIAGARMVFGTVAALTVAMVTQRLAQTQAGEPTDAAGFLASASLFAVVGTAVLLLIARGSTGRREVAPRGKHLSVGRSLRSLVGNEAFVTLNAAAAATAIASTLLIRSVLYYYADGGGRGAASATLFLFGMQAALTGFHFAFWAMLPDAVDYGKLHTSDGADAVSFGAAALLQKMALGVASGLIGLVYEVTGYNVGSQPGAIAQAGISWTMILGPAAFIAMSLPIMAASPLRRGTHAVVLAALEEQRRA